MYSNVNPKYLIKISTNRFTSEYVDNYNNARCPTFLATAGEIELETFDFLVSKSGRSTLYIMPLLSLIALFEDWLTGAKDD